MVLNILSYTVYFLHKLEKLSYEKRVSELAAINSRILYNLVTYCIVSSNTWDSAIIGIVLSLFEHACNTFLPSISNPKFLYNFNIIIIFS